MDLFQLSKSIYPDSELGITHVNLTVRANPTKLECQQAQLERYFLGCVSQALPLNKAQSNARAQAHMGERTHNLLLPMESHADKQQSTTNNIALPILQVSSLISNDIFNTHAHR